MESEDLVVQLSCGVRGVQGPLEVADGPAGLLDELGAVVATGALVFGNDGLWGNYSIVSRAAIHSRRPSRLDSAR